MRSWRESLPIAPILLSLSVSSAFAAPTDNAFTEVPSRFETKELTTGSRGLGEICVSRDVMPDGTACNPAFLPEIKESSIMARVYFGNGYSSLTTANKFVFEPISKEFLQELFQRKNVTSLEANAGIFFSAPNLSASFSPYRLQYVSEVHNPNLPVVAVHAALERNLSFASGIGLGFLSKHLKHLTLGTRVRILERKYVHGTFSLYDTVSQNPKDLLPVKEQRAVFLDPSIGWTMPKLPWKLRTSLSAKNIGRAWPEDPLYPEYPDLDYGVGLEPPVGLGKLRLGVDYVNLIHGQDFISRIRAGGSYQLGVMEPMIGLNKDSVTGGVQFGFQFVRAGIVYEFHRKDLSEGLPENRIATELAICI
jgi:hypothetical protein